MIAEPFVPADGETPRWKHCYNLVTAREPGDGITYAEITELLACTREQAQNAMLEARRHLEKDGQRTVATRTNFGWIVLDARGNLGEISKRRRKAGRQVTRAVRLHNATPRTELGQMERAQLDFEGRNLLAAQGIYDRRPPEVMKLQRLSKSNELPVRQKLDG